MVSVSKIEKAVCQLLTQSTNYTICNTLPKEVEMPLIHIAKIEQEDWMLVIPSGVVTFYLDVYLEDMTNIGLLQIYEALKDALCSKNFQSVERDIHTADIENRGIYQIDDDLQKMQLRLIIKYKGKENEKRN
jgi:hypothetical protein